MKIYNIGGTRREIAEHPHEMQVRQFINFTKQIEKMVITEDVYSNALEMAKCLAEYWECNVKDLAAMEINVDEVDEFLQTVDDLKSFSGMVGLFKQIHSVITDYTPEINTEVLSFTYRGTKWDIPAFKVSPFNNKYIRPKLKFEQIIEVAEANRISEQYIGKKGEKGEDLDPDGSYRYTLFRFTLAKLATNEEMDEIMTVDEKIEYFADIDMKTAIDVVFFLMDILTPLQMTQDFNISLILPNYQEILRTALTLSTEQNVNQKQSGTVLDGTLTG